MAPRPLNLAVLGAAGAVGRAVLEVLEEQEFPVKSLRLLGSARSAGTLLEYRGEEIEVEAVQERAFRGCDLAIFSAGASVSKEWAPKAWAEGCVVVDDSSAFAAEEGVPLVVPEVNPQDAALHRNRGVVANPASPVIPLVVALAPIRAAAGLERVVVSTYHSVSSAGHASVVQLEREVRALMNGLEPEPPDRIPHRIAFNVVPQIGAFTPSGYTEEETRMIEETRKVLADPALRLSATAVRVPVFYGHSESVNVTTQRKISAAEAREVLRQAPGLKVIDTPGDRIYPMPMLAVNDDAVLVGRIREDLSQENGLELFVVADNLRKGAAANAVQIARLLHDRYL